MADPVMKERTTALAAVFQAAALVDDIARGKGAPSREFALAVNSLFALDAKTVSEIFPDDAPLATGRGYLRAVLERQAGPDATGRINYVMAMIHLAGILRGDARLQQKIRTRLEQISGDSPSSDHITDDAITKIAALYVDTFGTLRFRVQVNGEPKQLQMPDVAARIRTSLFAGIRAAHLWYHLGGRRWHLLLGSKKMLAAMN